MEKLRPAYDTPGRSGKTGVARGRPGRDPDRVSGLGITLSSMYSYRPRTLSGIRPRSGPPIVIEDAAATLPLVVEMRERWKNAGSYELSPGARLQDAITAARGLTEKAEPHDGGPRAQAPRPRIDRDPCPSTVPGSAPMVPFPGAADDGRADQSRVRININTATAAELEALPGSRVRNSGTGVAYQ